MNKQKYESYFNTNVRKLLEELTVALLKEQPKTPVFHVLIKIIFMKDWINARCQQEQKPGSQELANQIHNSKKSISRKSFPDSGS